MKSIAIHWFCVFSILLFPSLVLPAVRVHDRVTVDNREVMLMVETRGRFFAEGGVLVQFSVDGTAIGSSLSGIDGFAFKSYIPQKQGLMEITARAADDLGTGIILSLAKESSIVYIDIEGCFLQNPFTKKSIAVGRDIISDIIKTYPIVYLQTGLLGTASLRSWLEKNEFPRSVIIQWKGGTVFSQLKHQGLSTKMVMGSQKVVESADVLNADTYVFDSIDEEANIKKWKNIKEAFK